jgi:mono/diheme cytochrome c family protein
MKIETFRFKLLILVVLALFAATGFWYEQTARGQQRSALSQIDFNRDIKPILSDKCFACHGPDAPNLKIHLRLDSEAAALAELRRGRRAVVPSHPEQSELVRRIRAKDEALRMPPVDSGRKLSDREIELLTEWIRQGAKWQQHWAFIPPTRPQLPKIKNSAWPKNAIDHFVLARLETEGLRPSPEADRATLLRRVSFDLTGLPPSPKELDDFLNDKSPNAYEKVVDRLLAGERYGERMAVDWMNAARYADTNGYQLDGERLMWRWRDWVINAYNRNLPFDQFTIQQLAGDLLARPANPQAALDQLIATAFNRNHRGNSEDGLVPEEYRIEYIVDRVDTTSTVFLGLTVGCARCHNHKYDPITQKEYYQLSAYFNSIPEDGRASNYGNSAPWIAAPTPEQQRRLKSLETRIAQTERRLELLLKSSSLAQRRWERQLDPAGNAHWFPADNLLIRHSLDESASLQTVGSLARINLARPDDEEGEVKPVKPEVKKEEPGFRNGSPEIAASPAGQGVRFDGKLYFDAGKVANFDYRDRKRDYKDNFAVSAWIFPEAEQSGAIVAHMADTAGETDYGLPKNKGWGLFFNNGKVHFNLVSVWADDSFRVETAEKLPLNQWHHVVATFDSGQPLDKVKIYINGREAGLKVNLGRIFRSFGDANRTLKFGAGGGPAYRFKGKLDEIRIYKALPEADQIAVLACADPLEKIAAIPPLKRTRAQQLKMQGAFLAAAAPAAAQQTWKQLAALKQEKLNLEAEFPTLMVMQETATPRPAYLLRRGAYDAPAEKVERAVPAVFPAMPEQFPNNRLGFARWLVSAENPLTARVQVNRLWQMLFGTGLVKTVEDFGSQGELPSHPELLDWLATEFQQNGWNVKASLKTMVMSATYRQSSKAAAELLQRDPENRLLARGARFRLPAEMIRDQALLTSGLLAERLGGPSVKPYQPAGLWKDMTFSNMTNYDQAKDEGLWRRSLYTFWKRTILNPAMLTFDATGREFCKVRETRTNTPLQALNLMNDTTYIEAARMLAQRMMLECSNRPDQRLAWAFRSLTSRSPSEAEQKVLLDSFSAQLAYFRKHPEKAETLLTIGEKRNNNKLDAAELAAYAMTASLILNLDETITKQ